MGVKSYIPSLNTGIKIAVTMLIIFFVVGAVLPEQYKKYFRV